MSDSGSNDIVSARQRMTEEHATDMAGPRRKREYDDRCSRVMRLVSGLIDLGCRPRVIELDGLYVEMEADGAVERSIPDADAGIASVPVASAPSAAAVPLESFQRPNVRSYRHRAQDDLRNRLRDINGDV